MEKNNVTYYNSGKVSSFLENMKEAMGCYMRPGVKLVAAGFTKPGNIVEVRDLRLDFGGKDPDVRDLDQGEYEYGNLELLEEIEGSLEASVARVAQCSEFFKAPETMGLTVDFHGSFYMEVMAGSALFTATKFIDDGEVAQMYYTQRD